MTENEKNDVLELGGNIELNGFSELDKATMVIVKKMIGSFAKKLNEHNVELGKITVQLKHIHKEQGKGKFEIHAKVDSDGKIATSEIVQPNLFFALDEALKKIKNQLKD